MSSHARARRAIAHVAARSLPGPPVPPHARVCLHLHPDVDTQGRPTLLRVLAEGRYLSQFATGTSNGGLTAHTRGDRWTWEHTLFGGAYDDAEPSERPVYGALDLAPTPPVREDAGGYGPAPRFGSAHLRLATGTTARATFAYPDSAHHPESFGVPDGMGLVALLDADVPGDPLDRYVEAHVHGPVRVPDDVEALVLDPSCAGGGLERAARAAGLVVELHDGYAAHVETIEQHPDYRGPQVVALARRLAVDGVLTPAILGRARGRDDVDARRLKQLWHCVARFGRATS
ncbi:DUF3626 domain-containing protein [Cellulosimicrobium terreum]|nr:DUF3626 domain-containing protein [Cellulosimicrobium terreum]